MQFRHRAQHRRPRTRSRHLLAGVGLTMLVAASTTAMTAPSTLASLSEALPVAGNTVSTTEVQPPSGLRVTRYDGQPPTLHWAPTPSAFATGYVIYAGTSAGGPYTRIGNVNGRGTTTWVEPEADRARTTYYVVTAVAHNWVSGRTNESVGAAETYESSVLSNGPMGYWRLGDAASDATLFDTVGDATATKVGGFALAQPSLLTTDTANTAAMGNSAGTAYAEVSYIDQFYRPWFTSEMWIKTPAAITSGGYGLMALSHHDGSTPQFAISAHSASGTAITELRMTSGPYGNHVFTLPAPLAANTTYHVVMSVGVNFGGFLSINGERVASTPGGGQVEEFTGGTLRFGSGDTGRGWPGAIDEVAIYEYALNADQVRAHYRAGTTVAQRVSQAPQNVQAAGTDKVIGVRWVSPPADDALGGYRIYRGTSASSMTALTDVPAFARTYTDTSVAAGSTYFYAVEAISPAGTRTRSSVVSASLIVPDGTTGDWGQGGFYDGNTDEVIVNETMVWLAGWALDTDYVDGPVTVEWFATPESGGTPVFLGTLQTGQVYAPVPEYTAAFNGFVANPGPGRWLLTGQVVDTYPVVTTHRWIGEFPIDLAP